MFHIVGDVCFESFDENCMNLFKTPDNSSEIITKWRFSPKHNKCVSVVSTKSFNNCQSKNIFHSEAACQAVCPGKIFFCFYFICKTKNN